MEPADESGTGQTSPRGNDWEVVQLTTSNYASSAPGPARPEPSDEESQGQVYGTEGGSDESALLMSAHFSVPRSEPQNLGTGSSKERQEARGSEYAVSDEGDDDRQDRPKDDDDLERISSFDKGKGLSLADIESDDGDALHMASLAGEDPVTFSSSGHSATVDAAKELRWSATEKAEDSTPQVVDPVSDSSTVVASGEGSKPDGSGSGVPRDAWLRKQMITLYRSAKESNKFWPVFVAAAAALMGMAYFRRRWLKGKLQLQQAKLQPASSKERINHAVPPLNRIKDILVAGSHSSPAPHGNVRLS